MDHTVWSPIYVCHVCHVSCKVLKVFVNDSMELMGATSEYWIAAAARPVMRLPDGKLGILQDWMCCFAAEL